MTSPAAARAALAASLSAALATASVDADVVPYASADGPATRARVFVTIRDVTPVPGCGRGIGLDVWAVSPLTVPGASDDDVDDLLGVLLDALDLTPRTTWSTAERGVWAETNPSYRIETEVTT